MSITEAQKVKAQDTISTTRYLNKEFKNYNKGEQTDSSIKFEHKNESCYYTARTDSGDTYNVLYYSNTPYMQSAKIKNDDGSIMTINRVEDGKTNTRYECDADGDGNIDYSFYIEYDEDGHLVSYKEDENADGEFDHEAAYNYENGKLKSSYSIQKNPETKQTLSESTSQYFGENPGYHRGEQEKTMFYDSNGDKTFSTTDFYDEAGRILERVYNDYYQNNDFWSKLLGKSNDYRIEYRYDCNIANYYNNKGKLIDSKCFDDGNIPT